VCSWDKEISRFIPFGSNRRVARLEQEGDPGPGSGGDSEGAASEKEDVKDDTGQ